MIFSVYSTKKDTLLLKYLKNMRLIYSCLQRIPFFMYEGNDFWMEFSKNILNMAKSRPGSFVQLKWIRVLLHLKRISKGWNLFLPTFVHSSVVIFCFYSRKKYFSPTNKIIFCYINDKIYLLKFYDKRTR